MAFIEIKNRKEFALRFIKDAIVDKKVTHEDMEELQNAEIKRKKDWEDWNDFQIKYRNESARMGLEELGKSFEVVNQNHIINNKVDELDIKIMKASFERRSKYTKRLSYILHLVSDNSYVEIDGKKYSMPQIYRILVNNLKKDTEKELEHQLSIAAEKLKLNELPLRKDNKYFLTPYKKEKLLKEIAEYERMLQQFQRGGFQEREGIPDILGICSEDPISTYKSIFDTNPIVLESTETYSDQQDNKKI